MSNARFSSTSKCLVFASLCFSCFAKSLVSFSIAFFFFKSMFNDSHNIANADGLSVEECVSREKKRKKKSRLAQQVKNNCENVRQTLSESNIVGAEHNACVAVKRMQRKCTHCCCSNHLHSTGMPYRLFFPGITFARSFFLRFELFYSVSIHK